MHRRLRGLLQRYRAKSPLSLTVDRIRQHSELSLLCDPASCLIFFTSAFPRQQNVFPSTHPHPNSIPDINIIEPTPSLDSTTYGRTSRRPSLAPIAPTIPEPSHQQQLRASPSKHKTLVFPRPSSPSPSDSRKRSLGPEDDQQDGTGDNNDGAKKTRVEGDELIDGDEDAEWDPDYPRAKRGSKRGYDEEVRGARGKRARKFSKDYDDRRPHQREQHHDMDVDLVEQEDEEDEGLAELPNFRYTSARGKKRDRAEAGSTFGGDGDGDDEDSPDDHLDKADKRRMRKRRTTRKSDFRLNAPDDELSALQELDEESVAASSRSRRRKSHAGRRPGGATEGSDVSMSDDARTTASSVVSKDPLCRGRKIGEEWEVHGVKYRVGPDGERLRQALVKTARSKFNMVCMHLFSSCMMAHVYCLAQGFNTSG